MKNQFYTALFIITTILSCSFEADASSETKNIYCAGRLSKISDLIFNRMLSDKISELSNNRYKCLLPQEEVLFHKHYSKLSKTNSKQVKRNAIKNIDIDLVSNASAIIVNMGGKASSVGSVVEFMIAKCMGKPGILYKTDVGHDSFEKNPQNLESGPWSVMLNYYPNTEIVLLSAGNLFRQFSKVKNTTELSNYLVSKLAKKIIMSLDSLDLSNSVSKEEKESCLKNFTLYNPEEDSLKK